MLNLLYGSALTPVHDYWNNRSIDYMDLCWQSNVSAFKYAVQVGHSFSSRQQVFLNLMPAVTICSEFGALEIKSITVSIASPSISHEVMGPDAMILVF